MPQVSVYVDAGDVLADLSDEMLDAEVERRRKRRHGTKRPEETWSPAGLADDLRSAYYARNASRFEALLIALEAPELRVPADGVARFARMLEAARDG